jgi:hypothetical protein
MGRFSLIFVKDINRSLGVGAGKKYSKIQDSDEYGAELGHIFWVTNN